MNHKFYVFNTLPITSSGIIGRDFLAKFKAQLDFENNFITLSFNLNKTCLPIISRCKNDFEILARSESIHYIHTEFKNDCLVCSTEIQVEYFWQVQ